MVVERPLVVVGKRGRRLPAEEVARQLEHIVGVAGFGGVGAEVVAELAGDGRRGAAERAVAPRRQRHQKGLVVEAMGKVEVHFLAGEGVQVGQRLGHAAVLAGQHLLHLGRAQAAGFLPCPVAELQGYRLRRFAVGVEVGVFQPGQHLMHGVPRHPAPVQIEARRVNPALRHAGEDAVFLRDAAHVARAPPRLALGQLGHQVIYPLFKARVAGGGIRQGAGREVVPQRVPRYALAFPAAVERRLGQQARVQPEAVQQPVGLQGKQVLLVALHRRLKGAGQQPHVA